MKRKYNLIIIVQISIIMTILLGTFIIDYTRYLNNKKPIFVINTKENNVNGTEYTIYNGLLYKVIEYKSKYGKNYIEFVNIFKKINILELEKKEYDFIKEYFIEKSDKEDGMCFNAIKIYNVESTDKKYIKEVSLWVRSECYYAEMRELHSGHGYSIPYKIILNNKSDLKIDNVLYPGDGDMYGKDMKKLFSLGVRIAMDNIDYESVNNDINQQVEEYFYPLKLNNN